jgi:tRNA (guanine-N7-)-methyltransferase
MRKKKNLVPRLEKCSRFLVSEPQELRGKWIGELMPGASGIYVEIGCGKGRFITETARLNPDMLFIGIERVPEALVIAMEKTAEHGSDNVFFLSRDAEEIDELFEKGEVSGIYLNFSDPWPKAKHAKRRLTHVHFLSKYKEILGVSGDIWLKTDNLPLFEFSLEQFELAGFSLGELTRDLHADGIEGVMTEYEEKFYSAGIKINRCAARLSTKSEEQT